MTFPAKYPQLNDTQLTERARTVLIRVVRVAFPHSRLPDGPYERTADIILKEAAASNWFRVSLTQGLGSLDSLAYKGCRYLGAQPQSELVESAQGPGSIPANAVRPKCGANFFRGGRRRLQSAQVLRDVEIGFTMVP